MGNFHQSADQEIARLRVTSELILDGAKALFKQFTAKTADYTVTQADSGKIFTTYGASANVNFTLPSVASEGLIYLFVNSVNYNLTVTAGTADTLITYNDTAADSVAFSTTSQKIGGVFLVFADGNAFYCVNLTTNTATVAT